MTSRTVFGDGPCPGSGYSGIMMLSRAETKALYDKISKVYDLLSETTEGPVREAGLQMLAPQPGETVLEIGYGTGHALVWLARAVGPSGKVHGIDLSDGMLASRTAWSGRKGSPASSSCAPETLPPCPIRRIVSTRYS